MPPPCFCLWPVADQKESLPIPRAARARPKARPQAVFTTLKEPTYPTFPQFPKNPEEDPSIDWQTYYNAYDEYYSAVMELRGGGIPEGTRFAVSDFAAKSTPLALAGQEGKNAAFSPVSLWAALAMLASPTTVSSFVMARSMGHEGTLTASTVMLTTFFSILTLTLWALSAPHAGADLTQTAWEPG